MKILVLASVLALTGCASQCTRSCIGGFGPGNSVFDTIANHYDTMDVCQFKGKPEGYQLPNYCTPYRGGSTLYVRDTNNRIVYRVSQ
jgi:hypothetical protein